MANEQVTSGLVEPQGIGEEPLFYFTRAYLIFLQELFAQLPTGSYRFSHDEKLREIEITAQAPIPKDRISARPHIVALRGPAQFGNLALDQMESVDPRTGAKVRRDLVACTMSLNCIAKFPVEAQRIAWLVMTSLRRHKVEFQRVTKAHKIGDELSIGPESPPGAIINPEPDPEWCMVTVQSPFFFMWREKVTPLDETLLRKIELDLHATLSDPAALSTHAAVELRSRISVPTIRGRVIGRAEEFPSAPIDQKVET